MRANYVNIPLPIIIGLLIIISDINIFRESEYLAVIEYESDYEIEDPVLIIKGYFINNTRLQIEAEYYLSVLKISKAGTANSDQKGKFSASPGEKAFLSTSIISIDDGSEYKIILKITEKNKLIAIKSIDIKEPEF